MEVHHHSKLDHKPTSWKGYLLEFLMIFLAVTMGFIAENIREHRTEEKNAKRFLKTYRNELLQQQEQIKNFETRFKNKIMVCDSVVKIYYNGEENSKLQLLSNLMLRTKVIIYTPFNTSAYEQMVNSGALRFITNSNLRDSIAAYKNQIEIGREYNSGIIDLILKGTLEIGKLEDLHDYVSTDTSASYDLMKQVPFMMPFRKLSDDERRELTTFYIVYIAHAQTNLRRLRLMFRSNQSLVEMINKELD